MTDRGLGTPDGAVCLDGSDAGFYFRPATSNLHRRDFVLYFEGGGWCFNEFDCWSRTSTKTGSSKAWCV